MEIQIYNNIHKNIHIVIFTNYYHFKGIKQVKDRCWKFFKFRIRKQLHSQKQICSLTRWGVGGRGGGNKFTRLFLFPK